MFYPKLLSRINEANNLIGKPYIEHSMKPKRLKEKKIKAWMFLTEDGQLVGEGQRSNDYFYSEEAAKDALAEMSAEPEGASYGVKFIRGIFAKWQIVPITITYQPTKSSH